MLQNRKRQEKPQWYEQTFEYQRGQQLKYSIFLKVSHKYVTSVATSTFYSVAMEQGNLYLTNQRHWGPPETQDWSRPSKSLGGGRGRRGLFFTFFFFSLPQLPPGRQMIQGPFAMHSREQGNLYERVRKRCSGDSIHGTISPTRHPWDHVHRREADRPPLAGCSRQRIPKRKINTYFFKVKNKHLFIL